ncbi:85/88 kDa calcium-independent phospholipase A2 isoform X1 [Octopus sinensis]|uniref:phospholipase A2 n=1 Tax=Octopus sinensis TaxID=2607531 RepID=A0A6P7SRB1_9MOLL|nr:85/88 kDa calcium-independent phospholipase A2 isoform X1 [Octopus sinensis]XP_036361735.1 85/88 kDa calcium-independent phospholipase A2 isoform X1 [Octopus sinensis]XP_036361736.1 85/88 kDa calcium-independent phospholipase A2 isoform X1 [Octopus sinensis]
MVEIFKNLVGTLIRGPYHVQIVNTSDYNNQVLSDPPLYLYKERSTFHAILKLPKSSSKVFSLFCLREEGEAFVVFNSFRQRLAKLIIPVPPDLDCKLLKTICDCLRENPLWSTAHIAAYVGYEDAFKNVDVLRHINEQSQITGKTALMVGVKNNNFQCVKTMLKNGAMTDLNDRDGNTIFHYAIHSKEVIMLFKDYSAASAINKKNNNGETPFFHCCQQGSLECTQALLDIGADPYQMSHGVAPIHVALKRGDSNLIELLCNFDKRLASQQDQKYGGFPIHWVQKEEHINILRQYGADINVISTYNSRSALHIMLEKHRYNCAMTLLSHGIDANLKDKDGNTGLHIAVEHQNLSMVRALAIFGTDLNIRNNQRHTARHKAALLKNDNGPEIVCSLNQSGASRCGTDVSGCLRGCVSGGQFNGSLKTKSLMTDDYDAAYDEMLIGQFLATHGANKNKDGYRVLCLDGGGIRGLITIQMLIEIEKHVGKPIQECFDWISGTSTGGILALAIAQGKPLNYCKSLYFRMKNDIFSGKRPYSSDKLEQLLKDEFGEDTVMSDLKRPKVMVTAVIADQIPPKLHLFQNYSYSLALPNIEQQPEETSIHAQKVWHAARCSGAAPTFFRACGKYLDGGLMSNNPTLDTLTEIHQYNLAEQQNNRETRPVGCVVSLGTGRKPVVKTNSMDVYLPENFLDIAICAVRSLALKDLIVHQVTNTDDQPVQQARSWCNMLNIPYFRFNPPQSEDIPLDCQDSEKIVDVMWETLCYCNTHKSKFENLATILMSR